MFQQALGCNLPKHNITNRQTSRDLETYNASGTPNTWLGRGGLRGGDMGGWVVGFIEALNLLSYLTQGQCQIINCCGF